MAEEKLENYGSIKSDMIGDTSYDSNSSFECNFDLSHDDQYSQTSQSYYSINVDESTPLNGSITTNTTNYLKAPQQQLKRKSRTISHSIAHVTHSISKHTTSNYFGFGSTSYAVAHMRNRGISYSRTVSLAHIPSLDRLTPTIVSFFTLLSMITGLSVFAIPLVVARCGWPLAVGIGFGGIALWYSCYLVNTCQYQVDKNGVRKRVYENYIELGRASLKWHGDGIMKILVGSSVLTDIYSLIFCAQISRDLTLKHFHIDDRMWMLIWIVIVFPLFFIRRMSVLAWLGFFSLVLYVAGFVMLLGLLLWNYNLWEFQNLQSKFNISYLFIGYGIILNSYNVHISIPAVEGSMKHPKTFKKINAIAFSINTIVKMILALTAAATFGLLTEGSVLSNMKVFGTVTMVINILIGLYMITQYPVSLFVVLEMLDVHVMPKFKLFKKGRKSEWVWMFLSRLLVTVFIAFVAVSIPNFEMVTGFIGNIRGTCATLIFPIYFYLKLHKRRISKVSYVLHCMLIVLVSCLGLAGASFSILGMMGYADIIL